MATITTRAGKGSPLTNTEVDNNFTNINTELGQKESASNKGVANGYASLDGSGKVPSTQLPSYVDDVVEGANLAALPATGETGKIYVTLDTNKTYRWSGSAYVEISASPGSTDAVTEGSTNLYFTNARARSAISATGSLSYNSSTGVMSFTDAVTSVAGKTGAVTLTNSDVGLGNVENKSSATIRGELTSGNVTTALGFTPYNSSNPSGYITSSALSSYLPLSGGTLTGQLLTSYSGARHYITDGTNNLVMGLWDGSNVRLEATGRPLYVVSYGGAVTIGRSSGSQLTIDSSSMSYGGNTVLHAGNFTSYRGTQLISPNGATVVAADSAMPDAGHSFIHTLALGPSGNDGHILGMSWAGTTSVYGAQIWLDTDPTNRMALRSRSSVGGWANWSEVLTDINYSSYALPLSGGTMTGSINVTSGQNVRFGHASQSDGNDGKIGAALFDSGLNIVGTQTSPGGGRIIRLWGTVVDSSGYSFLNSANYTSFSPTLTGGGASGTWGINITGNAATATSATDNTKLPLSGGTVSGGTTFSSTVYFGTDIQLTRSDVSPALLFTNQNQWRWIYNGGGNYWQTNLSIVSGGNNIAINGNAALHAANYNSYALPLSGGTISAGSGYPLILNSTQRYSLWVRNTSATGTGWWLTHDADGRFVIHGNGVGDLAALDSSGNWYASGQMYATGSQHLVLNTGNYSSYSLPLSGGTITGSLTVNNSLSFGGFSQNLPESGLWSYITNYAYDPVNSTRWYWHKLCNLPGTSFALIEYHAKDDSNYPHSVRGYIDVASYDGSSVSIKHDAIIGFNGSQPQVRIDNNSDVWIRIAGITWNNYTAWRVLHRQAVTFYRNETKQFDTPANSIELLPGQQVRATRGSVTGASVENTTTYAGYLYSRSNAQIDGYIGIGQGPNSSYRVITNGHVYANSGGNVYAEGRHYSRHGTGTFYESLTTGNYSSYALPLSGGTLSGTPSVSAGGSIDSSWTAGSASSWRFIFADTVNASGFGVGASGFGIYRNGLGDYHLKFATDGFVNAPYGLRNSGNQVLHAGNYTSYSPSLTGSGASGTWGINITGTSGALSGGDSVFYGLLYNGVNGDLNTYNSPGLYSAEYTGSTNKPSGANNGHWIQISDAVGTDVKTQWYFNNNGASIWMRVMWGNGSWQSWRSLLHDGNYSSYALPLSGGTISGNLAVTGTINGVINTTASGGSVLIKHSVSEADAWIFQENASNWGLYWKNSPSGHHTFGGYTTIGAELFGMSAANASLNGVTTSNFVGATSAIAQWMISNYTGYIWSASTIYAASSMVVGGNTVLHAGNYTSYSPSLTGSGASGTWGINITGNASTASNSTNLGGNAASYYDHRAYSVANNYLGGYYIGSGTEKPNDAIFGAGKLKIAMLQSSNLGFGGPWNDVLWISTYNGGDVKQSYAIVGDKYSDELYFSRQAFDSASWGTGRRILHSGNYTSFAPSLTGSGASGTWSISITGNAGSVNSRTVGNSTDNIAYFNSSRNLFVTNPESYSGEVRLGAAWGRGGVYASNTLTLATSSSNIDFVFGDVVKANINNSGHVVAERFRGWNSLGLSTFTTVNPSSNVFLYSQANDRDAWIFLDSADTGSNWGIYHRQIDSAVSGLEANSIGFIGGGNSGLRAFIGLSSGNIWASGNVTAYSDERVKTNWREFKSDFVERLSRVKSGTYDRTDIDGVTQVGVSAQSLKTVIEYAVTESDIGDLSVAYGNAALVSAVELAKEIVNLKREIEMLKTKLH